MEYSKITTPEELLQYMDENVVYGVFDFKNNKRCCDVDLGALTNQIWKLSSPKQMQQHGTGHCYDQVELERDFFKKQNFAFKTFFIWFNCKRQNAYPTHTYLVYQDKKTKKWCWFEHADFINKGIHIFDTLSEAINAQKLALIRYAKQCRKSKTDPSKIEVFEYDNVKYGCSFCEFIDHVLRTGKQIEIK